MTNIYNNKILILDFGSQYTQLIARNIREIGVYCELFACDVDEHLITEFNPKGIILSGGPDTVKANNSAKIPKIVFQLGIPVLGICYGMQAMAVEFGGDAIETTKHEYGFAKVRAHNHSPLLNDISDNINSENHNFLDVWMSHSIKVNELPKNFVRIASTNNCKIAGFANIDKQYYGLQFHPEVTHTKQGKNILSRFVIDICKCKKEWLTKNITTTMIQKLKNQIANNKVILGLSGGVDSSVLAVLLHKAISNQLSCIFIDNGLLRLNEENEVMRIFSKNIGIKVIKINARKQFYTALKDIYDPEEKRKIIGKTFIKIFEQEAKKLDNVSYLAQGTIYPDMIESAGFENNKAKVIKSHHNVGGLPKNLKLKLIEPLKYLFKDEVRNIGINIGIPKTMILRHPFPGPGLAVRILGQVKQQYIDILRLADNIFIQELQNHKLYDKVNQAFSVFLPVKSVGVTGDSRRYEYVIALRAVETIDFMTAKWAKLPYDFLELVSNRITSEIPKVSRVVYDISGKPPATIEWE